MNKKVVLKNDIFNMNFEVFYPDNYTDLPLLIYLHGAGERGTVIEHLSRHGIPKYIELGNDIPAVVLCPQCPAEFVWNNVVTDVKKIIDSVVNDFGILNDRICITGSSMGGFGTWEMGLTYPTLFSAIAPVAGGGLSWRAHNLITTPVFAYHGDLDATVPISYSQLMVDAVNNNGGKAELSVIKGHAHNDGINEAYFSTDLIEKLINSRRTDFTHIDEVLSELF